MPTFVLVGGEQIVRLGLTVILNKHFKASSVLSIESESALSDEYSHVKPDLVILINPVMTPHFSVSFTNFMKVSKSRSVVIFDKVPDNYILNFYIKRGVIGFLMIYYNEDKVVECCQKALKGEIFVIQEMLEMMVNYLANNIVDAKTNFGHVKSSKISTLTKREQEVAHYLISGMKNCNIGITIGIKPSTVSTIKNAVFKKLNIENIIQLKEQWNSF